MTMSKRQIKKETDQLAKNHVYRLVTKSNISQQLMCVFSAISFGQNSWAATLVADRLLRPCAVLANG